MVLDIGSFLFLCQCHLLEINCRQFVHVVKLTWICIYDCGTFLYVSIW